MDAQVPRGRIRRNLLAAWIFSAVLLLVVTGMVFAVLLRNAGHEQIRTDMARVFTEVAQRLEAQQAIVARVASLVAERSDVVAGLHLVNVYEDPATYDTLIFGPEKARLAGMMRDEARTSGVEALGLLSDNGQMVAFYASGRGGGHAPASGYGAWVDGVRTVISANDGRPMNIVPSFASPEFLDVIPGGPLGGRADMLIGLPGALGLLTRHPVMRGVPGGTVQRAGSVAAGMVFGADDIADIVGRAGMEVVVLGAGDALPDHLRGSIMGDTLGEGVPLPLGGRELDADDLRMQDNTGYLVAPARIPLDGGGNLTMLFIAAKPSLGAALSAFGEASILALLPMALLVIPAGALALQRLVIAPLEELARAAEAVRHGRAAGVNLGERGDEVGTVARAFNDMVAALMTREAELRDSRQQYRDLYDYAPVAYASVAVADGRFRRFNLAFAELTGLSAADLERRHFLDLFPRAEQARADRGQDGAGQFFAHMGAGRVVHDHELHLRRADGTDIWVSLRSEPVRDAAGTVIEGRVAMVDVDARKRAEDDLRVAVEDLTRANVELTHFAHVAAHDLREPVRRIVSYVQLLERAGPDAFSNEQKDYMAFVSAGARRIYDLVGALLEYAEAGGAAGRLQPVAVDGVVNVVRDTLSQNLAEAGGVLDVGPLPTLMADETQLIQVFQNLLSNAIKFRAADRPLHVTVSAREDIGPTGQLLWVFSVQDNGIGFDPVLTDRIFDMFQRLHPNQGYPGTGIGLPICRKIIEANGGRIWADSQPDRGSTFNFLWPANAADTAEDTAGEMVGSVHQDA